ncbi:hypothetical protein ABPG75_007691 [Micractinium tetrahymenae]
MARGGAEVEAAWLFLSHPGPLLSQELPDAAAMEALAEKWRPFRSVGSYFMWKVEAPRGSAGGKKGRQKGKKA